MITMLKNMMKILSLNCHGATEIISQSMESPPPRHLRLALRVHKLYCKYCRRFEKQLQMITRMLHQLGSHEARANKRLGGQQHLLSDEARSRMKQLLS